MRSLADGPAQPDTSASSGGWAEQSPMHTACPGDPPARCSPLPAFLEIKCFELCDPHGLVGETGDDFELPAHRFDVIPQGAQIHIGAAFEHDLKIDALRRLGPRQR